MKAFEKNIRKVEPYVPGEQPQRKVIQFLTFIWNPIQIRPYTIKRISNILMVPGSSFEIGRASCRERV